MLAVSDATGVAGAEHYLATLAVLAREHALARVVVAVPAAGRELRDLFGDHAVPCVPVFGLRRRPTPSALRALRRAARECAAQGLLVNLTDQGDNGSGLLAAALSRPRRSVAVVHLWVPGRPRWRQPVYGASLRATSLVVTPGEGTAADLRGLGLRVQVVPNGLPVPDLAPRGEARAELGLAADALVVGGLGRLEPQKGWDVLARALPGLQARLPQLQAVVVGDGSQRAELAAAGVTLPGPRSRAARLLSAFDVVVVPSRYESHALVPIEAALAGVPCVLTDIPGVRESATEASRLVASEDVGALVEAVGALAGDLDAARRDAAQAAHGAAVRYDPLTMTRRTLALLLDGALSPPLS